MQMAKKKTGIQISFVDSCSSEDVTGSLIYICTPTHKILVDAGMAQSNDKYEDFLKNNRKFKEFKAKDIDYIFVTHLHIDHCGIIPRLVKDGCNAKIIISDKMSTIMKDMLTDCAEINERDIDIINSQHNKSYKPLYTIHNVNEAMCNTSEFPINEKIVIDETLSFQLIPNGHLIGSVQILLYLTCNNITKTVLVTGDIGNKKIKNYFVGQYQHVNHADIVIGESTYGDRPDLKTGKKERTNDLQKIKSIIETQIHEMNGRVIIPTFANSRCQQLALLIYEMYKDSEWKPKVYIDSPLAIKLFQDYQEILDGEEKEKFDELLNSEFITYIKDPEDSKALVASCTPCLIMSTSGMCQCGRIRHHLKKCISNSNTTILFVGFSTDGSLASILKDNKRKTVKIDGKEYVCRCASYSLKSFSGHAPFGQLIENYTNINCSKLILHHGSSNAKVKLKESLDREFYNKCKSTRVVISNSSLKFSI